MRSLVAAPPLTLTFSVMNILCRITVKRLGCQVEGGLDPSGLTRPSHLPNRVRQNSGPVSGLISGQMRPLQSYNPLISKMLI